MPAHAWERARAELPALAERLGLNYRPSAQPGRAGELNGILRGHRVLVRPDRPALFVEYRFRVEGLRLSTARPRRAPAETLRTGHRGFERTFPLRVAPGPAGAALRGATAFHEAAVACMRRWRRRLVRLDFEGAQVSAMLKRRGLLRPRAYLTAAEVEALLPQLLGLVEALEAALRTHALGQAVRTRP
ncbi:MAG TPA: hypothetical protein VKB51_02975 [bacterium]|nr:hypothetical protein [bacterium]